jgi:hypothetical protein
VRCSKYATLAEAEADTILRGFTLGGRCGGGLAISSSPSLLSGMSAPSERTAPDDEAGDEELDASRDKLPRTLSTSVLRIKHRSSFWEKFWEQRSKRDT